MNNDWVERGKKVIMNTYGQFPLAFVKGEGSCVWDADGKKYLDFVAGIAVNALGYNDQEYCDEIAKQLTEIQHISNLYWIRPQIELAELLIQNSGFDRAFFCNSGAEAIEAAIKLGKKYGLEHHGEKCYEIITMEKSFHGRTMATLTLTGQRKYQKGFKPLLPGVSYVEYNNFEALEAAITQNTCAILIEPIQGEGGIVPSNKEYLTKVRKLCDEKDIVLIFDEVQCGIGRAGKLFAHQHFGVVPDVISLAKGLGGGVPIGAMLAVQSKADALVPGNHASTFGGNYISCTAGKVVIKRLLQEDFLPNVMKTGEYLTKQLKTLQTECNLIVDVRGIGLMQGIELNIPVKDAVGKCIGQGLLLVGAGTNVIRFVPPLIVTKREIDEAMIILKNVLLGLPENN